MTGFLLIFLVIDILQHIYIRKLKKEIALRDGTYVKKPNRFLVWLKELFRLN